MAEFGRWLLASSHPLRQLVEERAAELLNADGIRLPPSGPVEAGRSEARRIQALAKLRACTELGDVLRPSQWADPPGGCRRRCVPLRRRDEHLRPAIPSPRPLPPRQAGRQPLSVHRRVLHPVAAATLTCVRTTSTCAPKVDAGTKRQVHLGAPEIRCPGAAERTAWWIRPHIGLQIGPRVGAFTSSPQSSGCPAGPCSPRSRIWASW